MHSSTTYRVRPCIFPPYSLTKLLGTVTQDAFAGDDGREEIVATALGGTSTLDEAANAERPMQAFSTIFPSGLTACLHEPVYIPVYIVVSFFCVCVCVVRMLDL